MAELSRLERAMVIRALCACGKCFKSFGELREHQRYCAEHQRIVRLRRCERQGQ